MDALLFLFISSLEWLALIVLTFAMFKFGIRGYWGQLVFTSFLLSLLSYLIFVVFEWNMLGPLLQLPVVFLFFWQMYRVPVFYAGLMVVNGYLWYALLQTTIFYAFYISGLTLLPDTPLSFVVQSLSAGFAFLAAWQLIVKNIGFTFVPDTERIRVEWNGLHRRLLIMTVLGYAAVSSFKLLYVSGNIALMILALSTVIFGFLQYFVLQKEYVRT
ncbi:hypothetical protein [Cohnella sp.]|uniref:hypothetical protein n=1 Tax=Cohnella sp. TaxID=1883426 RepID=UPI003563C176